MDNDSQCGNSMIRREPEPEREEIWALAKEMYSDAEARQYEKKLKRFYEIAQDILRAKCNPKPIKKPYTNWDFYGW